MKKQFTALYGIAMILGIFGYTVSTSAASSSMSASATSATRPTIKNTWFDQRIKNRGFIYFYEKPDPSLSNQEKKEYYYEFTNFFEAPITIDKDGQGNDLVWPTTEQYYQAGKFDVGTPKNPNVVGRAIRGLIREGQSKNPLFKGVVKGSGKDWGAWAFYVGNESQLQEKRPDLNLGAYRKPASVWTKPDSHTQGMPTNMFRMLTALRAKFRQNPALGKMLLATYPKVLVEDSPKDGTFGASDPAKGVAPGKGQNLLGRMLMHVRKELFLEFVQKDPNFERPFDVDKSFSLDYLLDPTHKI